MSKQILKENSNINLEAISVSELSRQLKCHVEQRFASICVCGEISALKQHSSGHVYFALKDAEAVIDAVCWRSIASSLGHVLSDGMAVKCIGSITTYMMRSKYQLVVRSVQLQGEGALLQLLQKLKQKLQAEGLFDIERKRPIPFLPRQIGVITSPTGAVIQDILHRIQDRFPCTVLLWPVAVQGASCVSDVTKAIESFTQMYYEKNPHTPDVLIVARGGGSVEDLWGFNDEQVVRAAALCPIPIISAVGHETDVTLIDFVADHRAPTPTAAAEKAVPVRREVQHFVNTLQQRMHQAMMRMLESRNLKYRNVEQKFNHQSHIFFTLIAQKSDDLTLRLKQALTNCIHARQQRIGRLHVSPPYAHVQIAHQKVNIYVQKLHSACQKWIINQQTCVQHLSAILNSISYHATLKRGFALIRTCATHEVISSAQQCYAQENIQISFADGSIEANVLKKNESI